MKLVPIPRIKLKKKKIGTILFPVLYSCHIFIMLTGPYLRGTINGNTIKGNTIKANAY